MNLLPALVRQKATNLTLSLSSLMSVRDQLKDRTDSLVKVGRSKYWIDPVDIRSRDPPFIPTVPDLPKITDVENLSGVEKEIYSTIVDICKKGFNLMKWANLKDHKLFVELNDFFKKFDYDNLFEATDGIDPDVVGNEIIEKIMSTEYEFDHKISAGARSRQRTEFQLQDHKTVVRELVGVIAKLHDKIRVDYEVHQNMRNGLLYNLEGIRMLQRYADIETELENGKSSLNKFISRTYQGHHFADGIKPIRVPGCPRANMFHDLLENDFFAFAKEVNNNIFRPAFICK